MNLSGTYKIQDDIRTFILTITTDDGKEYRSGIEIELHPLLDFHLEMLIPQLLESLTKDLKDYELVKKNQAQ